MTPPALPGQIHYNPILITVLPTERRARHPYQLCIMFCLITLSLSQIIFGPPPTAAITNLPAGQQLAMNIVCLAAGIAGVFVAFIPERIVHWIWEFDATWVRLITEAACHFFLAWVWVAVLVTILQALPFIAGLSFGSAAAFWLAVASIWRGSQIAWQVAKATLLARMDSALVGAEVMGAPYDD